MAAPEPPGSWASWEITTHKGAGQIQNRYDENNWNAWWSANGSSYQEGFLQADERVAVMKLQDTEEHLVFVRCNNKSEWLFSSAANYLHEATDSNEIQWNDVSEDCTLTGALQSLGDNWWMHGQVCTVMNGRFRGLRAVGVGPNKVCVTRATQLSLALAASALGGKQIDPRRMDEFLREVMHVRLLLGLDPALVGEARNFLTDRNYDALSSQPAITWSPQTQCAVDRDPWEIEVVPSKAAASSSEDRQGAHNGTVGRSTWCKDAVRRHCDMGAQTPYEPISKEQSDEKVFLSAVDISVPDDSDDDL